MLEPAEEPILVRKFRRAARREKIEVPEGFAYVFYILNFAPGSTNARQGEKQSRVANPQACKHYGASAEWNGR